MLLFVAGRLLRGPFLIQLIYIDPWLALICPRSPCENRCSTVATGIKPLLWLPAAFWIKIKIFTYVQILVHCGVLLLNSKCYLRVMKIFYHHRDNSSCLLDASQIQISFVYWNRDFLSSVWGNYLCRDTQKLHLPAAREWKSLSVIGGFGCPERSSSVSAADTLDYPLAFRWNLW